MLTRADTALAGVYADYRKLLKALVVGVMATLVQMAAQSLLNDYIDMPDVFIYVVAYHAGMIISFTLNKTYTFENTSRKYGHQLLSFAAVAYSQLLLNAVLFSIVQYLVLGGDYGINWVISTVVTAFIGFVYAFLLNKSFTFKIFR